MALPLVANVRDCADFSKTVVPFIPQIKTLPSLVISSIGDPAGLKQLYLETNPLVSAFAFTLAIYPLCLVISEINKNYSQVDRIWSILPTVYNAHYVIYAHLLGWETKRLDTMLAASCIWSCRLTYNYWRKGGYQVGSEDYRWEILRNYLSPTTFFLFNITFISLVQPILLFAITTPSYIILLTSGLASANREDIEPWTTNDLIISRVMLGCIFVAFFADQQQWQYHQAKQSYQKTAKVPAKFDREDLDRGFLASGLWAWVRHPNFTAEQSLWLALYQWGCNLSRTVFNWTGVGAMAYLILFQASTVLTEYISAGKYPEYREYQARVGKFIPRFGTEAKGGQRLKGDDKNDKRGTAALDNKKSEPIVDQAENKKDAAHARERYDLR